MDSDGRTGNTGNTGNSGSTDASGSIVDPGDCFWLRWSQAGGGKTQLRKSLSESSSWECWFHWQQVDLVKGILGETRPMGGDPVQLQSWNAVRCLH